MTRAHPSLLVDPCPAPASSSSPGAGFFLGVIPLDLSAWQRAQVARRAARGRVSEAAVVLDLVQRSLLDLEAQLLADPRAVRAVPVLERVLDLARQVGASPRQLVGHWLNWALGDE